MYLILAMALLSPWAVWARDPAEVRKRYPVLNESPTQLILPVRGRDFAGIARVTFVKIDIGKDEVTFEASYYSMDAADRFQIGEPLPERPLEKRTLLLSASKLENVLAARGEDPWSTHDRHVWVGDPAKDGARLEEMRQLTILREDGKSTLGATMIKGHWADLPFTDISELGAAVRPFKRGEPGDYAIRAFGGLTPVYLIPTTQGWARDVRWAVLARDLKDPLISSIIRFRVNPWDLILVTPERHFELQRGQYAMPTFTGFGDRADKFQFPVGIRHPANRLAWLHQGIHGQVFEAPVPGADQTLESLAGDSKSSRAIRSPPTSRAVRIPALVHLGDKSSVGTLSFSYSDATKLELRFDKKTIVVSASDFPEIRDKLRPPVLALHGQFLENEESGSIRRVHRLAVEVKLGGRSWLGSRSVAEMTPRLAHQTVAAEGGDTWTSNFTFLPIGKELENPRPRRLDLETIPLENRFTMDVIDGAGKKQAVPVRVLHYDPWQDPHNARIVLESDVVNNVLGSTGTTREVSVLHVDPSLLTFRSRDLRFASMMEDWAKNRALISPLEPSRLESLKGRLSPGDSYRLPTDVVRGIRSPYDIFVEFDVPASRPFVDYDIEIGDPIAAPKSSPSAPCILPLR